MITCDNCGATIPQEVLNHRNMNRNTHTCNRQCETERRKKEDFYKQMSVAGNDARSKAVAESNHSNPRRKRKIS